MINEEELQRRAIQENIAAMRLHALTYQPFGIGNLFMATKGDWLFGIGCAATIMAAGIGAFVYFGADGRAREQERRAAYVTYMRECVPEQPASRCMEIFYWSIWPRESTR